MMTIDERLENTNFPLPAIREVNMSKHPSGISLGLGELKGFPVDVKISDALVGSFNQGGFEYTQNAGLPQLRSAVAEFHKSQDGYGYTAEHVVITIGVQNAVYSTLKTVSKLGARRVLIPSIHFGIYKKIPIEFGMEVICYPLTADFGVDIQALGSLLRDDDIVLINSPSNPTGRVFSSDECFELAQLFKQKLTKGYVLSDEIYGKLVYEGEPFQSFMNYFERTIVVDGVSKSGAVAGLRVGWMVTRNIKLAKAITSNNATVISTPPTSNQYGAIPVVAGETQQTIEKYQKVLRDNRDKVLVCLDRLGISYNKPTGSFYIFPNMSQIIGENTKEFCLATASKENGVVVIPGVAFGAPSFIRISLATDQMDEALLRFEKAVVAYSKR